MSSCKKVSMFHVNYTNFVENRRAVFQHFLIKTPFLSLQMSEDAKLLL
jgi:hypothetical protein